MEYKGNKAYKILVTILLMTIIVTTMSGCSALSATKGIIESIPKEEIETNQSAVPDTKPSNKSQMSVHFIDVGQGDAILVQTKDHAMLVDAGENDQGEVVIAYLESLGITSLDYVIGTHPHSDHIGGLDDVIEHFEVKKVILPDVTHTTKTFRDMLTAIDQKGLSITKAVVGDTYSLGDASFVIIAPNRDYKDDLNNWSVGIKLTNQNNSFVMYGDAELEAEYDMCDNGIDLKADVLKLGHHGSTTSSSEAMMKAVNPKYAVIMCGKDNSYGHPHKETIKMLEEKKIKYFRTDEQGTITAVSDGVNITWN